MAQKIHNCLSNISDTLENKNFKEKAYCPFRLT